MLACKHRLTYKCLSLVSTKNGGKRQMEIPLRSQVTVLIVACTV